MDTNTVHIRYTSYMYMYCTAMAEDATVWIPINQYHAYTRWTLPIGFFGPIKVRCDKGCQSILVPLKGLSHEN